MAVVALDAERKRRPSDRLTERAEMGRLQVQLEQVQRMALLVHLGSAGGAAGEVPLDGVALVTPPTRAFTSTVPASCLGATTARIVGGNSVMTRSLS